MKSKSLTIRPTEAIPDTAALQARAERRIAQRWGVSLSVAAVLTSLAGIGPQMRDAR